MDKPQIIQLVTDRLANVGHGITFEIIEDGVRQEESWWYIPVLATRRGNDVPREVTVTVFANVEDEIEQQHGVSVLIIPAVSESGVS